MSAAEYQTNLREIIVPLLDCLIEKKRDIKSRTGIDVPTINNFIQNTKILHLDDLKLLAEYFFINRVTYSRNPVDCKVTDGTECPEDIAKLYRNYRDPIN